jgi:hypothetical protein
MVEADDGVKLGLNDEVIKQGLGIIGKHPILLKHTYLYFKAPAGCVTDISSLEKYPNLMYLKLANNKLVELRALSSLPTLVQLDVSNNELTNCLNYEVAHCKEGNSWIDGDEAIGSMLTLANLSNNKISQLRDLSHHAHLEVLMLSNNAIKSITGLHNLNFLKVLDLSYNNITKIEGLDGLNIQELNLEGNHIMSLTGLAKLAKLAVLNVKGNRIGSLHPLKESKHLTVINACDNEIKYIRNTEYLSDLQWLGWIELMGNPCAKKHLYRRRVIFRLPFLTTLDKSDVSADERVEMANCYRLAEGSDLLKRANIFQKYNPDDKFTIAGPNGSFIDDEQDLTEEKLCKDCDFHDDVSMDEIQSAVHDTAGSFMASVTRSASAELDKMEDMLAETTTPHRHTVMYNQVPEDGEDEGL